MFVPVPCKMLQPMFGSGGIQHVSGPCVGLSEFTNQVSRIRPYPLPFCEKGFVFSHKLCLLPRSSIVCTAGVAVGEVDDLEIWK